MILKTTIKYNPKRHMDYQQRIYDAILDNDVEYLNTPTPNGYEINLSGWLVVAISNAISHDDVNYLRGLCSLNIEDYNNSLAKYLFDAMVAGDFKSVELLLKGGINPNIVDTSGKRIKSIPLHCALFGKYHYRETNFRHNKIIELLLEYGADINAVELSGDTPLTYIIKNRDLDLFQNLIDRGADRSLRDQNGETPEDIMSRLYDQNTVDKFFPRGKLTKRAIQSKIAHR